MDNLKTYEEFNPFKKSDTQIFDKLKSKIEELKKCYSDAFDNRGDDYFIDKLINTTRKTLNIFVEFINRMEKGEISISKDDLLKNLDIVYKIMFEVKNTEGVYAHEWKNLVDFYNEISNNIGSNNKIYYKGWLSK